MRPALACADSFDLELDPVALLKMMNAPIEGQQELESMIGLFIIHIISCNDMLGYIRGQGPADPSSAMKGRR